MKAKAKSKNVLASPATVQANAMSVVVKVVTVPSNYY